MNEIESIEILYSDINVCISDLIKARLEHNEKNESECLYKMEGLLVSTLQELTYLHDYIENII